MKLSIFLTYFLGLLISHNIYASDLIVTVENIQSNDGTINVALFTNEGDFPDESTYTQGIITPAEPNFVQVVFTDLPANDYAIAVYQDENNNGKLDTNFFGIPKEPYGFSGNSSSLTPPSFREASSALESNNLNLTIKLR